MKSCGICSKEMRTLTEVVGDAIVCVECMMEHSVDKEGNFIDEDARWAHYAKEAKVVIFDTIERLTRNFKI